MKLYSYEESGNSYKIRLLLSFLDLPYEKFDVDLMADAQHQPAYLAVNPNEPECETLKLMSLQYESAASKGLAASLYVNSRSAGAKSKYDPSWYRRAARTRT